MTTMSSSRIRYLSRRTPLYHSTVSSSTQSFPTTCRRPLTHAPSCYVHCFPTRRASRIHASEAAHNNEMTKTTFIRQRSIATIGLHDDTRQVADSGFRPPAGNYRVIVMQPDISVGVLTAGGGVEPARIGRSRPEDMC